MKVVIVDDESIAIRVLSAAILATGLVKPDDIKEAMSIQEAEVLISAEKPDFILLDLTLKEKLDGLELLKYVKSRMPFIKVCIVSADVHIATIKKCLELRADLYVKKPFSPKQIEKVLYKLS